MKSAPKQKWTLASCCGAHAVQDGLGATLYVLVPLLAESLGLNYAQVGLIRAVKSAAMSLLELPSGLLAERWGEGRLLVFGLACASAGTLWLASADGLTIVLASLFVSGIGSAFQHALCSSLVSRTYSLENRRSALGLYNSSGDAGKLTFTAIFSLLVGFGFGWPGIVVLFGIVALTTTLLVAFVLSRIQVGGPYQTAGEQGQRASSSGWGIRDVRGFSALCTAVVLDTAVQSGFLVFLALLFADKGVATEYAASAVVLTLVGGIFGKAGCGYLAERVGVRVSLVWVQLLTALGLVALVLVPPAAAFFVLPLLGLCLQGSTSITYGCVGDYVDPDRQSRGFGVIYGVSGLASVTGPVLFGLVGDSMGLGSAMLAMAIVSLVMILPCLGLRAGGAA